MTTPQTLKEEFKQAFGVEEFTPRQLWIITKFAKYVRLRARNNAAFNNLANQVFAPAQFKTVTKTRINRYSGQQESYPGLSIVVKGAETAEEEGEE